MEITVSILKTNMTPMGTSRSAKSRKKKVGLPVQVKMIPFVNDLLSFGFFAWVGVAVSVLWALWLAEELYRGFMNFVWSRIGPKKDFVKTYGKWAVITGGSDGIGKGWAMEFAKREMCICVISNEESNITKEIQSQYPVEVVQIVEDLSNPECYDRLELELSQLEIGVLVNNVGMFLEDLTLFFNTSRDLLDKMVEVNTKSVVMMSQMVLKKMVPRNKGLIINVGSLSSVLPFPYATVYGACKSFVEEFSLCLHAELAGSNIQVHCVRPYFVNTNLVYTCENLTSFLSNVMPLFFPRPLAFASSAAAILNNESIPLFTCGYWSHSLLAFFLPLKFINKSWFAWLVVHFERSYLKTGGFTWPAEQPLKKTAEQTS